jgi:hypothetical protein
LGILRVFLAMAPVALPNISDPAGNGDATLAKIANGAQSWLKRYDGPAEVSNQVVLVYKY